LPSTSGNNQDYLKSKSSAPQSLSAAAQAPSTHIGRDRRGPARTEDAMQDPTIRRHADGSIDYGFYHRRAARLRNRAIHRTLGEIPRRKLITATVTAAVAALTAVAVSAAPVQAEWTNGVTGNGKQGNERG
jgi:hypothetical protein